MPRTRRGMLVKNLLEHPIEIKLAARLLALDAGEEAIVTPSEAREESLREHLQLRTVAVVRPSTAEEEAQIVRAIRHYHP
ncbi:MAG TPA: hypothetical protein PLL64_01140 [Rhodothermales bacterium]|nr:hypothetical protein [Bacteroidota bacterium]HRK72850.1 hypothetical protein [Rhodothermales bacterium]HRR07209.1 hypothetical protein [Rhodothermales bacterium]